MLILKHGETAHQHVKKVNVKCAISFFVTNRRAPLSVQKPDPSWNSLALNINMSRCTVLYEGDVLLCSAAWVRVRGYCSRSGLQVTLDSHQESYLLHVAWLQMAKKHHMLITWWREQ